MPLVSITTNRTPSQEQTDALLTALTERVAAELNKPKEYVQVCLDVGRAMQFAGTHEPTAFVELRSIGLTEQSTKPLSAALTELIGCSLVIPGSRIFLNLLDVPRARWGWDGSTFG